MTSRNRKSPRFYSSSVAVLLTVATAGPLLAQELPAVGSMLHCFEVAYSSERIGEDPECTALSPSATGVLKYPDRYPEPLYQSVLDGLETMAFSHADHRVRYNAGIWVAVSGVSADGTVERMRRIYDRSDDALVRATMINNAPHQAESAAAVAFLEHVASGTKGRDVTPFPDEVLAVNALTRLGAVGRAALQDLNASNAMNTDAGREQLSRLARNGYRIPDHQKRAPAPSN